MVVGYCRRIGLSSARNSFGERSIDCGVLFMLQIQMTTIFSITLKFFDADELF